MKDCPLVTVVTATYNLIENNRVEYFRQCVESVRTQTYGHIEHLFIDGASTDGTCELLKEYESQGWGKVYSEPDKGIYDAFNKGIARASGKYIAFLNSDDWWHDARGVELSVHMLELAAADFSYSSVRIIDEQNEVTTTRLPRIGISFLETAFCHQSMFTRTELLRAMGGFDAERYRIIGDQDVITRLILQGGKAVNVPLNFVSFRRGGISTPGTYKELYTEERRELYRQLYGPMLSKEELEQLASSRYFTPTLLDATAQMLHPSVLADLTPRCVPAPQSGMYRYQYQEIPCRYLPQALGQPNKKPAKPAKDKRQQPQPTRKHRWNGPLGLPLLSSSRRDEQNTCYYLFRFIPLISAKVSQSKEARTCRWKLFHLLPLLKTVSNASSQKAYLFFFLPLWSHKAL